jgi:hypothetical protein
MLSHTLHRHSAQDTVRSGAARQLRQSDRLARELVLDKDNIRKVVGARPGRHGPPTSQHLCPLSEAPKAIETVVTTHVVPAECLECWGESCY